MPEQGTAVSSISQTDQHSDPKPTTIRFLVVVSLTAMAVLLYLDRFCVSFAVDYIREDLRMTQTEISWFLSAFFWSYALAQVPSGWLSDRYGARIMLTIYILSWSFFTAMIGAATSFAILLFMRLGCGLGQAGAYPTSAAVVSKWIPFAGRGRASSIIAFGGRCGGAIAPLLTAFLIVLFVPVDEPVEFSADQILNAPQLCAKLSPIDSADVESFDDGLQSKAETDVKKRPTAPTPAGLRIWSLLSSDVQLVAQQLGETYREFELAESGAETPAVNSEEMQILVAGLNQQLDRTDIYEESAFRDANLAREAIGYLKRMQKGETLSSQDVSRFNRLLLEAVFTRELGKLYVHGWRPVMYVYGLAGLLVAGMFWVVFRNHPTEHPRCNAAEQAMIELGRPAGAPAPHGKPGMVPFKRLATSRSMWFVCAVQVGTNVGWVFLVTWLPRYLIEVHQVPILERGLMAMVPLTIGIFGMLAGGVFTDSMVSKVGLRWGRRLPLMSTRFLAAFGYVLCLSFSFSGVPWLSNPWCYVFAFSLVAFSTDMGTGAVWAFKQDVGGRYVGSILGWGNMWGNLGAAVSPPIYNYFLGENPAPEQWNHMFLVCMGAFLFAGFCAFGVDATIPIAPPDEEHEPDSKP